MGLWAAIVPPSFFHGSSVRASLGFRLCHGRMARGIEGCQKLPALWVTTPEMAAKLSKEWPPAGHDRPHRYFRESIDPHELRPWFVPPSFLFVLPFVKEFEHCRLEVKSLSTAV
jgi:hypothetical protein